MFKHIIHNIFSFFSAIALKISKQYLNTLFFISCSSALQSVLAEHFVRCDFIQSFETETSSDKIILFFFFERACEVHELTSSTDGLMLGNKLLKVARVGDNDYLLFQLLLLTRQKLFTEISK